MDSTSETNGSQIIECDGNISINIDTENVRVEGLTSESDPTVPGWAKTENKPSYTAEEVGALPATTFIPTRVADLQEDDWHQTVTEDEKEKWNNAAGFSGDYNDLTNKPQRLSDFENDEGFITEYYETDPTVPGWAKTENKPSYTAEEVGALPSTTHIPATLAELTADDDHMTVSQEDKDRWNASTGFTGDYNDLMNKPENLSEFNNDEGFITEYVETDPTVPEWAKQANKPSYTAEEVGALPATTVIPTKASDLEDDLEVITTTDIDSMWEGEYSNE